LPAKAYIDGWERWGLREGLERMCKLVGKIQRNEGQVQKLLNLSGNSLECFSWVIYLLTQDLSSKGLWL
jgi:hypothetical protein